MEKDYKFISLLVIMIILLTVRIFILEFVVVKGNSMYPTYEDGDKLTLLKYNIKLDDLKFGDVIVFNTENKSKYIKRIIGVGGDEIHFLNDVLYVNGEEKLEDYLSDNYIRHTKSLEYRNQFTNDFGMYDIGDGLEEIPEGYFMVLGDNRPHSTDSRSIGLVKYEDIVGVILDNK